MPLPPTAAPMHARSPHVGSAERPLHGVGHATHWLELHIEVLDCEVLDCEDVYLVVRTSRLTPGIRAAKRVVLAKSATRGCMGETTTLRSRPLFNGDRRHIGRLYPLPRHLCRGLPLLRRAATRALTGSNQHSPTTRQNTSPQPVRKVCFRAVEALQPGNLRFSFRLCLLQRFQLRELRAVLLQGAATEVLCHDCHRCIAKTTRHAAIVRLLQLRVAPTCVAQSVCHSDSYCCPAVRGKECKRWADALRVTAGQHTCQ